ncbi:MAG: phosphatase PAP2 family protein [Thermoanaerobaculia bacterium]
MTRTARFRPEAFEVLALVAFVSTLLTLLLGGLRMTPRTLWFIVRETGPFLLLFLGVGAIANVLYRLRPAGTLRQYLQSLRSPSWLLLTLRIWVAGVLLLYAYTWLKVAIPLLNERLWDAELARLDQTIHAGLSPSRFLVALFEGTPLLRLLDDVYAIWLPLTMSGAGFFAMTLSPRARAQFFFSYVMIWTLGVWTYVALPALGPALAYPWEWTTVHAELPRAFEAQALLMSNYGKVVESRMTGVLRAGFNPSLGVAAMPSLHVGIDALLLLWCFRRARSLAAFFIAALLLTFLGSIVTGWHFAVDAYVGCLLAGVSFAASKWVSLHLPDPEGNPLPRETLPDAD